MGDRIPVFDGWGSKVGDFIPSGSGEGCGLIVAAIFFFLFSCLPVLEIVAPPIIFFWVRSRPDDFPRKKMWVAYSTFLLVLWVIGMLVALFTLLSQ